MYEYSFRNSVMCHKVIEPNPQSHAFQQLLPPDSQLPKLTKQSTNIQGLQDSLNKKSEQIKSLSEKNHELIIMLSQKQAERVKINKKYNQLMVMYDQLKANVTPSPTTESHLTMLTEENKILSDKIRKLQRDLLDSEKQLMKKVKFYQDKNQDSRKLLQKLNENITKRQQKFKIELQETQTQLKKKNQQYIRLQQQYRNLVSIHGDKQEQLTRLLQQTERDRSAFSQNASTIQGKLQSQNNRLIEQVTFLTQIIQQRKKQAASMMKELSDKMRQLQKQNRNIKPQLQAACMNLQEISHKYDQLEMKHKQEEAKNKVLEAENLEIQSRLNQKIHLLESQKQQIKHIQKHVEKLKKEHFDTQLKLSELVSSNQQYEQIVKFNKDQIQKIKNTLKNQVQNVAQLQIYLSQEKMVSSQSIKLAQQLEKDNKQLSFALKKQNKKVENLEELLEHYKKQKSKIRAQMQKEWGQMTKFYEKEIQKLSNRIVDLQSKSQLKFSPPKIRQSGVRGQEDNS